MGRLQKPLFEWETSVKNNKFVVKAKRLNGKEVNGHKPHPGRTDRHGIWEGIKLTSFSWTTNGGKDWWYANPTTIQNNGFTHEITVDSNNCKIQLWAEYEIHTLGMPHRKYPFFHFADIHSKNRPKYQYKDENEKWTLNFNDWHHNYKYKNPRSVAGITESAWDCTWSDWVGPNQKHPEDSWVYKNAKERGLSAHWMGGICEYRNGQGGSSKDNAFNNGWVSVQGNYPQEVRKNVYFVFKANCYSDVITSSGITPPKPPDPEPPKPEPPKPEPSYKKPSGKIKIFDAYQNKGDIELSTADPYDEYLFVSLFCYLGKDRTAADDASKRLPGSWKQIIQAEYPHAIDPAVTGIQGVKFTAGKTYRINIDFDKLYGEEKSGNKIFYEFQIFNTNKGTSMYVFPEYYNFKGTNVRTHHTYNARPTIPTVILDIKDRNTATGKWHSNDPDPYDLYTPGAPVLFPSHLTYEVELSKDGGNSFESILPALTEEEKKEYAETDVKGKGTKNTEMDIDISKYPPGTPLKLRVRAFDNRIHSKDWGYSGEQATEQLPEKPTIILPLHNSRNYNPRHRLVVKTNAKGQNNILCVKWNGKTYTSKEQTEFFSSETLPTGEHYACFKAPLGTRKGDNSVMVWSENSSGEKSPSDNALFHILEDPWYDIVDNDEKAYIYAGKIPPIRPLVNIVREAYGLEPIRFEEEFEGDKVYNVKPDTHIWHQQQAEIAQALLDVDNKVKSYTSAFSPDLKAKRANEEDNIYKTDFQDLLSDLNII